MYSRDYLRRYRLFGWRYWLIIIGRHRTTVSMLCIAKRHGGISFYTGAKYFTCMRDILFELLVITAAECRHIIGELIHMQSLIFQICLMRLWRLMSTYLIYFRRHHGMLDMHTRKAGRCALLSPLTSETESFEESGTGFGFGEYRESAEHYFIYCDSSLVTDYFRGAYHGRQAN